MTQQCPLLIQKKYRNNIVLLLTAISWFILGIWYGFGFCPSTERHWQVRMKLGLGHYDMPSSYTKFLIDFLTAQNVNAKLVDILALLFLFSALLVSILTKR